MSCRGNGPTQEGTNFSTSLPVLAHFVTYFAYLLLLLLDVPAAVARAVRREAAAAPCLLGR